MKFSIKHESRGRIRCSWPSAVRRWIRPTWWKPGCRGWMQWTRLRCMSAPAARSSIIKRAAAPPCWKALRGFSYQSEEAAKLVVPHTSRATNREYQGKLGGMVCGKRQCGICSSRRRCAWRGRCAARCPIWAGRCAVVAAAAACGAAGWPVRGHFHGTGDFGTAGSVMFLLGLGELLEEWTHKKVGGRSGPQYVPEH